jgi:hypothetical protein
MKMFLVSQPLGLLLVHSPEENNHETTLVVPELLRSRIEYYRCLVDAGTSFKEHAVVLWSGKVAGDSDAGHVARALNVARPTTVTFVGEGPLPERADGSAVSETGLAACAATTQMGLLDASGRGTAFGMSVTKTGRFYTCEPL